MGKVFVSVFLISRGQYPARTQTYYLLTILLLFVLHAMYYPVCKEREATLLQVKWHGRVIWSVAFQE